MQTKLNRLAQEKSPYLLQHAGNPVDWYPWSEEAFEKARAEGKPIFLSIGYSTCHWCHVMEEESFENADVARIMNENFVSVKVDREERPDVDQIYMQAVMAMSGSGGWPMSVFLTPDLEPFYAGTYFPPEDMYGRPGFRTLLLTISQKWKMEREKVLKSGNEIAKFLNQELSKKAEASSPLSEETLQRAYEEFTEQFDANYGGFGAAPKFPRSHSLSFLLRAWKRFGHENALEMTEKTLQAMAQGGMWDHLGGGFHRYSTDPVWHVPHFEKMLYDQALLSRTYLEAYQATGKEAFAQIAKRIFDYVLRDMTDAQGGFFSAEDADSAGDPVKPDHKSEGAFYIWSRAEIMEALGKEDGEIFAYLYDVREEGNAENDPQGEFTGKNILRQFHTLKEVEEKFKKSRDEILPVLEKAMTTLFEIREKRQRPHLDDKVLTDWNGLMISSLAYGARVLGDERYGLAAKKAADFILANMKRPDGRLMHRYRDGDVAIGGFIEDYAFFTNALADLYEATFEERYLEEAVYLTREMIRLFWDTENEGFFFTGKDAEKLITKMKEIYDGALPSGNSVAALVLLRLGRLTMNKEFEEKARLLFAVFSEKISNMPSAFSQMMIAFDFATGPSREIVIAAERHDEALGRILTTVNSVFAPNQVVAFHPADKPGKKIEAIVPFLENQKPLNGEPTVYICKNYVCDLPLTDLSKLSEALKWSPTG